MLTDDAAEQAVLRILVADGSAFQRRLTTETLRAAGRAQIDYAENIEQCLMALSYCQPDVLIADWDIDEGSGLTLVKRIRAGEAGDAFRKLAIIMVATRNSANDVQRARNVGIDEFVLRPFSTQTLRKRIADVRAKRRDFVESTRYIGPCRRRRVTADAYDGPRRRLFDSNDKQADAPDVQIRKGLARMYCERIGVLLRALKPGDAVALRDLGLTCGQLSALAGDMKDRLLMSATSSLFNYIKGVGAEAPLNLDVVQAHLDSIVQLAELPNYQVEIRQTVTQQLTLMVTKKLRQAGQAA
ncbi:MAG: response regulator [Alphaproteobacteria bacterium]|nr:response regulator [Alphaproteobacteria bacterium]